MFIFVGTKVLVDWSSIEKEGDITGEMWIKDIGEEKFGVQRGLQNVVLEKNAKSFMKSNWRDEQRMKWTLTRYMRKEDCENVIPEGNTVS